MEGITEWLPISSTGHLILLGEFVKLDVSPEFWEMFEVVIQLGAIMAVVVLYWKQIFPFRLGVGDRGNLIRKDVFSMWFKIAVSCIPAIVVGMPFDSLFNRIFYNYYTIAVALIVFGVAFILIENRNRGRRPKMKKLVRLRIRLLLSSVYFSYLRLSFRGHPVPAPL